MFCALTAAFLSVWHGREAFAAGAPLERPAGRFVITETLPRGLTCRAAYGDRDPDREEWLPYPQWRGEKSYHPNRDLQADTNRQWYHFDAEGKVLGHLAQAVAAVLRGKDNPLFDPIRDVGAFAIVTNCEKVRVSGKKYHYKLYFRNLSFRPGHLKVERFKDLQKRFPERIIMRAVWGSMPKTPSCRRIFKERLKLFTGPNHLYYQENPIEYPMHTIKDCTPSQNLRKKDRIVNYMEKLAPRAAINKKALQEKEDRIKLKKFKGFLSSQMREEGPEAVERLELDELVYKAERARMSTVLKENEGKQVPKKVIRMYPGTQIPKFKISSNKRR